MILLRRSPVRFVTTMLTLAVTVLLGPLRPLYAEDTTAHVNGIIVSVRGNILDIRPLLRPITQRVAIGDKTVVTEEKMTTRASIKPGLRVLCGGAYSEKLGPRPEWIEVAEHPVGFMGEKFEGIMKRANGERARVGGTLKSIKPFVITDDTGTDFTLDVSGVTDYYRLDILDHSLFLIGVRVEVEGVKAPDGVIQAASVYPFHNSALFGMMFGTITGMHGNIVDVEPRYKTGAIHVTLKPPYTIQREIRHDPDSVKVGDTVTFWGFQHHASWETHKSDDLTAVELLIGPGHNPGAATTGDNPAVFLTGKLASLEPTVQLALPSGKRINVTIPAQMPVASLMPAAVRELKPGTPAMMVLSRNAAGEFDTQAILLDASPWVGFGR